MCAREYQACMGEGVPSMHGLCASSVRGWCPDSKCGWVRMMSHPVPARCRVRGGRRRRRLTGPSTHTAAPNAGPVEPPLLSAW